MLGSLARAEMVVERNNIVLLRSNSTLVFAMGDAKTRFSIFGCECDRAYPIRSECCYLASWRDFKLLVCIIRLQSSYLDTSNAAITTRSKENV
jgi:hypothetical protein